MTNPRKLKIAVLLVCLVGSPILAFRLGWSLGKLRSFSTDSLLEARFAQLEFRLLGYYDEHGAFPPTRYQREPGGPVHSWRVLLLPYMPRRFAERYPRYDFSQEWNSTNNLQALGHMPDFDLFSKDFDPDEDITYFLAIGENDQWPSRDPLRSRLITKGTNRFLLVLYPNSRIHWMEPKY